MTFHREKIDMVKKQYPAGTRIRLNSLCNDEQGMRCTNIWGTPASRWEGCSGHRAYRYRPVEDCR